MASVELRVPCPHRDCRDLAQLDLAEGRQHVDVEETVIELEGSGSKPRAMAEPLPSEGSEGRLARRRGRPALIVDLRRDSSQERRGVDLGHEGRRGDVSFSDVPVGGLVATGRKLPDAAELPPATCR